MLRYAKKNVKNKHKSRKVFLWLSLACIILVSPFVFLYVNRDKPPLSDISTIRILLEKAEKVGASSYCKSDYNRLKQLYDSAVCYCGVENEKMFFLRHYDKARYFVSEAKSSSQNLEKKTLNKRNSVKMDVDKDLAELRREMKQFDKLYTSLVLSPDVMKTYSNGKILLNEAQVNLDNGKYDVGKEQLSKASKMIYSSYNSVKDKLEAYFKSLDKWQNLKKEAFSLSKTGRNVIFVEKIPSKLYLLSKGKVVEAFDVEFGRNWLGFKNKEGDMATPEGIYKVTKKLSDGSSKYYKALLLNYPNAADKLRIAKLKSEGVIPKQSKAGSLIEIHGNGGRGFNWTNGCIAVTDKIMDRVFSFASLDTPIYIVGATSPMNEILK